MNIRFYTDPATGLPHIYKHGVDEREVEDVLNSPTEDRSGREGSRIAIGQTRAGRCASFTCPIRSRTAPLSSWLMK